MTKREKLLTYLHQWFANHCDDKHKEVWFHAARNCLNVDELCGDEKQIVDEIRREIAKEIKGPPLS